MRYFFSENADRPLLVGGQRYTFEIVARIAGTSQGVVAIPDDRADAVLAGGARLGIEEITAEAYNEAIEKKKRSPHSQVSVNLGSPAHVAVPLKGNGGAVVESGVDVKKPAAPELPPIEDTFDLSAPPAPAAAPTPPPATTPKQKRAAKKGE